MEIHMLPLSRLFLLSAAVLAGCATQPPPGPASASGKHLVYRDANGALMRQFDYPSESFCKRVEAAAGRSARCQADSVSSQLHAKATLRYSPPGVLVESHYSDLARCQRDNSAMSAGVELVNACSLK
jgi:hypothetical protein